MDILFATETLKEAAIETFLMSRIQLGISLTLNEKEDKTLKQSRMYSIAKYEDKYIVRYAEVFDDLCIDESLTVALPFMLLSGVGDHALHLQCKEDHLIAVLYSKNGPFMEFTASFDQCKKVANLNVDITENSLEFKSENPPKVTDPKEGLWSIEDLRNNPLSVPLRMVFKESMSRAKREMEEIFCEKIIANQIVGEA